MIDPKLQTEAVIKLHDIARYVENDLNAGELGVEIRKCADALNILQAESDAII